MRKEVKTCKNCGGKHIYSSEASATRAMNKYPDIKRVYLCEHGHWHTSSWTKEMAEEAGFEENNNIRPPTAEDIEKRLKELTGN